MIHQKTRRLRRRIPNVHYDAEIHGATVKKELPFVVGVLGPFCGQVRDSFPLLQERSFIGIDRDNFDTVLSRLEVKIHLTLPNRIDSGSATLPVSLSFRSIHDFEPASIIAQFKPLQRLVEIRKNLTDRLEQLHDFPMETTFDTAKFPADCRDLLQISGAESHVSKADAFTMLTHALATADQRINSQLSEILHHPSFQQLESSWRGMHFLVMHTETGNSLKLKMFPVTKEELRRDLNNAPDLDMSIIFKRVHVRESSTNEDAPFGLLIGDFEFNNSPDDHTLLRQISRVCAKNYCPMISAISPDFLGLQQWSELAQPMDIQGRFDRLTSATWSAFRDAEDSRFVVLTLPRVLACLPGHLSNRPFDTLATCERLNELTPDESTAFQYEGCWMNAAYVLAANITRTFEETGWVTDFHGVMNSGVSENVPACQMLNLEGGTSVRISGEVRLAGRCELELKSLGLMPLCYSQQLDTYLFSFTQTCHRSKRYLEPEATANAELAAQLPFVLASSRIAHFLQCIARDTHRPFLYRDEIEERLNQWIKKYVAPVSEDTPLNSRYPLGAANISVQEIPGRPGSRRALVLLLPYLPDKQLTVPMRVSIELP